MARLRRDLSLRDIAQRAGLSVNTVVALEKGKTGVSVGAVANVLHALGLADHVSLIAQDDQLGRKLQDLELTTTSKRGPKRTKRPVNKMKDNEAN